MMKTFLSGVFSKLPSMCNFYFINYGRFCGSPSWSQAIKIFYNGYWMERLHNPLIDSKLFHNSCNLKHLETITISRTCRCWGFNELKPNTLGLRHKSGLQNQFVFLKNHCGYFKNFSSFQTSYQEKNKTTAIYIIALVTLVLGGSYAAVPLYRIFCQVRNFHPHDLQLCRGYFKLISPTTNKLLQKRSNLILVLLYNTKKVQKRVQKKNTNAQKLPKVTA